jgi:hypothetical protein
LHPIESDQFEFEPHLEEEELQLDSFSSSLSHLDLLDTVLADFTRGKLKSCDKSDNFNVIDKKLDVNEDVVEDLEPLIESIPVHDINWVESGVENLPIINQTQSNIVSSVEKITANNDDQCSTLLRTPNEYRSELSENQCDEGLNSRSFESTIVNSYQSRLSDSFCDEIFTELERTSTFPRRRINWSDSFPGDANEFLKTGDTNGFKEIEKKNISTKEDIKELFDLNANKKSFEAYEDIPEKNSSKDNSTPQPSR